MAPMGHLTFISVDDGDGAANALLAGVAGDVEFEQVETGRYQRA